MRRVFRGLVALAFAGALSHATLSAQQPPVGPGQPLSVQLACSPVKPRTIVAELTLRERRGPAGVVEVTTYKDGFETRTFARLLERLPGRRFQLETPRSRAAESLAGLNLVVAEVAPTREPGSTMLRVEGLEPGLNYFWRLGPGQGETRAPTEVIRLQAPVCPADFQPEPKEP